MSHLYDHFHTARVLARTMRKNFFLEWIDDQLNN